MKQKRELYSYADVVAAELFIGGAAAYRAIVLREQLRRAGNAISFDRLEEAFRGTGKPPAGVEFKDLGEQTMGNNQPVYVTYVSWEEP